MDCSNHQGLYLNFYCYSKLKPYFSENRITESGKEYLKKSIDALKVKGKYNDSYSDIFYDLAGSFMEYHAFLIIGQIPSCKLINYMLNAKFGNTYKHVDETLFEDFKEFTDLFFKEYSSISSSCKRYMKYLEGDELYKMKTLYTLYDEYEKFTPEKKTNTNILCSDLNVLRVQYNPFLNKYDGKENTDELMEKLINLKESIEKNPLLINAKCQNEIKYFHSPTQYLEKKNQEREKAAREAEAAKVAQQRKEAEQAAKNQALPGKEPQETRSLQVSQTSQETQDELRGRLLIQSQHAGTKLSESLGFEKTRTNLRDPELYESGYTITAPPSGEGIMDSIKGTFNRIVENVEPAPILGVSGGMGVLFIILKVLTNLNSYTYTYNKCIKIYHYRKITY
ncbi:hypothetical protein PVNG_05349 [Plasmodium vivax North Korean]|uniref:VIR protein n=1 Tax=Plasmodium vivax North Korean TaxID=1035514 RepID=A0A0J9WEM5_PLAVI|nr:hypothetical protein PVNG_05349 [Plasmodium vivax North Korean]